MQITILPLKALYVLPCQQDAVAIVSSSYPVCTEKLGLPHIAECYDDLDVETPGRSLSSAEADRIAGFIRGINPGIKTVYTACDSGQCRSAAVACAVSRYFGMDDRYIWENPAYRPNPLVFRMLCSRLGTEISDALLDELIQINYYAFRRAIKQS